MSGATFEQNTARSENRESATWLAILDEMPIGVTVADACDGRIVLRNSITREILGRGSEPAFTGNENEQIPFAGAFHEGGRPYRQDEYPLARALLTGEVIKRELMHYQKPDGRMVVLEVNASRIAAHDGRLLGVCTFQDVTDEYERRQRLSEAAERVQLALHAGAIVGTWVYDVQADALTADELFARSLQLDPEQCRRGLPASEAYVAVHPDDRAHVQAAVREARARGGPYRCQYRVRQPDGGYRWVEASGLVELDSYGRARRFPGVLLDITAWKHAEEARSLLMREVDHRARNALAMVQSVVRLTDASEPARYRDEVLGRVDAMARAQASLARTNWEGAALAEVVREEVAALAPAGRFHISGPDTKLAAAQVQPLDMIIHELGTNALKYGALSAAAGRVEVCWRSAGNGELQLTWRECGGPPVAPPQKVGFGTRLIARLATQLGGAIAVDWRPAGLVAILTWRLERTDQRALQLRE